MLSDSEIRERLGPLTDPEPPPSDTQPSPMGRVAALLVLVLLLWGGGIALILHLEKISPRVPEPISGHTWRFSDHRRVVYLTSDEHWTADAAIAVPLLSTLAAAFFVRPRKPAPAN